MTAPASTAFDHVPRTRQGHFRLNFYAAVYRLIYFCGRLGQQGSVDPQALFAAYPFLEKYLAEMARYLPEGIAWSEAPAWWEKEIATWEMATDTHLPLVALRQQGFIVFTGRLAFMLAGLVEEDFRFGSVFAKLQEPLAYRRPCLTLIGQILVNPNASDDIDIWEIFQPLLQGGYLEILNADAPRSEWLLRIPSPLWDAARGEVAQQPAPGCRYHPPTAFPPLAELIFPSAFLDRLEQAPALIEDGKAQALVLRGMEGSERLEVAGAIARRLGRGIIELRAPSDPPGPGEVSHDYPSLAGPLCTLAHAMPVITYELGPGEAVELPVLSGYVGPLGALVGLEGGLKGPVAEKSIALSLPMPGIAERQRHWRQVLDGQIAEDWPVLCERFQLPGGHIRRAGTLAGAYAALEERRSIRIDDVRQACRTLNRQLLDTLAVYLEADGSWQQLVVSAETGIKLRELEQRCRHRERLLAHLGPGFGKSCNRGVRALFTGASGTGKTLAARILVAELGMDLYRVDLGAVVNKYIGETEKNLHRVLSRAEELDVVLLLDEGDALLGNRTEVKSANDRYANLETNYLLQRLENYQGVVIVTTNAGQNIDNAFQRRMDVVVHFVPPQALERQQIWQLHLPVGHAVDPGYIETVAARCALTGGQIRNAALHATLLAVDEGNAVVRQRHLEQAVLSEYRKAGAAFPLDNPNPPPPAHGGMTAFLDALGY
jgi:hypothetical protein